MSCDGYVDLQVNGYKGIDFSSPELTESGFLRVSSDLLNHGTSVFLPTVITSSQEIYKRNLGIIKNAVDKEGLIKHIPGLHLEGPFLSKTAGIGCHNPDWVMDATREALDLLIETSGDFIKLLTVAADAPEITGLIEYATTKNITVSLGHHMANSKQMAAAAHAGAQALTHLGNALPNSLPRHENPIWDGLANDDLTAMIITDGHHLPDEFIKCAIKIKKPENIVVVSDASPGAGLKPGRYNLLGNTAVLEENGRLHNPEKQCLVGSASTMVECMDYLKSLDLLTEDELTMVGYTNPLKLINHTL